jgi:protein-S-isoprenylcysteine O-methyltransferase Ste14
LRERSFLALPECPSCQNAGILLFWQWRPLCGVVWEIDSSLGRAAIHGVYAMGWAVLLISTFLINHFDLFGLRQVWLRMRRQEYSTLRFKERSFYKWVRHPLYVGWLLIFWAAPTMTITHLFFAVVTSVYILVAIQFEEKDLIDEHGEKYLNYKRRVPMLVPRGKRNNDSIERVAAGA